MSIFITVFSAFHTILGTLCYAQSCLTVAPQTAAHQTTLPTEFFRQEYWNGLPFPTPGDLPNPGIEPVSLMSPALASRFFTTSTTWEAYLEGELLQFYSIEKE